MRRMIIAVSIIALSMDALAAKIMDKGLGWPGRTLAGNECFGGAVGFGPYDYSDPNSRKPGVYGPGAPLPIVERSHFTPEVEQLVRGSSHSDPNHDLDYTLRAFPNHYRALWAMSRYYLRQLDVAGYEALLESERKHASPTPPECYFQRAAAFAPEDRMVSAIYGIYLHRRGKLDEALAQYHRAEEELPKNGELANNIGLLYLDRGEIEKAKEYAKKARALGYPLSGLQRKIDREVSKVSESNQ